MTGELPETTSRDKVDSYVATARLAVQLLDGGDVQVNESDSLHTYAEALEWLEEKHFKLSVALHVSADHDWHEAVWDLAAALTAYHHRKGSLHDLVAPWRAALVAAEHLDESDMATIVAHRALGDTYAATGWHDEAAAHLGTALTLAEWRDDREAQAHTHFITGIACERREDDDRALEHYTRARELFRETGNAIWEATALDAVASHETEAGDYDQAREHIQTALELHREHGNPIGEGRALKSVAHICHETGDHAEAIELIQEALAIFRDHDHTYEVAGTLDQLGKSYAASEQRDEARAAWREAQKMYREQGRTRGVEDVQKRLDELDADKN